MSRIPNIVMQQIPMDYSDNYRKRRQKKFITMNPYENQNLSKKNEINETENKKVEKPNIRIITNNVKFGQVTTDLEKKMDQKKQYMRRLRCKVNKLCVKILKIKCGHLNYFNDRSEIIDLRLETKNKHLTENYAMLTKVGKRHFRSSQKLKYEKPVNLWETKGLKLPKENLVEKLCKYLDKDEIEEIADDPIFYLSNSLGKPQHPELLDNNLWSKESGELQAKGMISEVIPDDIDSFLKVFFVLFLK